MTEKDRAVAGEKAVTALDLAAEPFGLSWPGKAAAFSLAMAPPTGRLLLDEARSVAAGTAPHWFIEGENLEALKLLLPEWRGQVRLIYIDPPYNTGQNFVYNDRFALPRARRGTALSPRTGSSARLHAPWLSMLYPRLMLARELLRPDGAIGVSIGYEELHHLLCIMHEIFGEDCFKNIIVIRRGVKNVQAQFATVDALQHGHEYVVLFAREATTRFPKLLLPGNGTLTVRTHGTWNNHWRGTDRPTMRYPLFGRVPERGQWRWGEARSLLAIARYQRVCAELATDAPVDAAVDAWVAREQQMTMERVDLLRLSRHGKPEHYVPPSVGRLASDLWTDLPPNGSAQLRRIFGAMPLFETPKSSELIRRLIALTTEPGDAILDFFAGTCTTAQAVIEENLADGGGRRYLCAQTPNPLAEPVTLSDGTVLRTIADIGFERIRRITDALGFTAEGVRVWRIVPGQTGSTR